MFSISKEMPKELQRDMGNLWKIIKENSKSDKNGYLIGFCDLVFANIPVTPKTLQKRGRQSNSIKRYKELLREQFDNSKDSLESFKGKNEVFLILHAYLSKKHFNSYDLDNISKRFCDVLKEYIGDDVKITSSMTRKREIIIPEGENLAKYEQFLVLVADPKLEDYLFNL